MSISNYSELKSAVAKWIHRNDLASIITDFIMLAESKIYDEIRTSHVESSFSYTISSGSFIVPSGYVELKYAYVESSSIQKLSRKDPEWIFSNYPSRESTGVPKFIARDGESFILAPYPDSNYTIKGSYYKRLESLSETNTSNWLTDIYPDLILSASCAEAAEYARDSEALGYWSGKYESIKARINRTSQIEAFSGSQLFRTAQ